MGSDESARIPTAQYRGDNSAPVGKNSSYAYRVHNPPPQHSTALIIMVGQAGSTVILAEGGRSSAERQLEKDSKAQGFLTAETSSVSGRVVESVGSVVITQVSGVVLSPRRATPR